MEWEALWQLPIPVSVIPHRQPSREFIVLGQADAAYTPEKLFWLRRVHGKKSLTFDKVCTHSSQALPIITIPPLPQPSAKNQKFRNKLPR